MYAFLVTGSYFFLANSHSLKLPTLAKLPTLPPLCDGRWRFSKIREIRDVRPSNWPTEPTLWLRWYLSDIGNLAGRRLCITHRATPTTEMKSHLLFYDRKKFPRGISVSPPLNSIYAHVSSISKHISDKQRHPSLRYNANLLKFLDDWRNRSLRFNA